MANSYQNSLSSSLNASTASLNTHPTLEELRLATIRGHLEVVKNLVNQGLSVNQVLKGGWSPLLFACSMGHPEIVEYLLQQGADPNFHKELFTGLMAACASTRENEDKLSRCVDSLVKHGANINAVERHRISALMFASKEGHQKLVSQLAFQLKCNLDLQDSQGWTALFWAVNQGKTKIVEILVRAKADLLLKDRRGQTALDIAYNKGLDEIAAILTSSNLRNEAFLTCDQNDNISLQKTDPLLLDVFLQHVSEAEKCDRLERQFDDVKISMSGDKSGIKHDTHISETYDNDLNNANNNNNSSILSLNHNKSNINKNGRDWSKTNAHPVDSVISVNNCDSAWYPVLKKDYASDSALSNSSEKSFSEPQFRNTPYSVGDAITIMGNTVKHLSVLFASASFIRLRLQGRPINLPAEKKFTGPNGLAIVTEKALHQAERLYDELRFLHEYALKLEECDKMVPADVIVEQKHSNYSKMSTIFLVSALVVVVIKNYVIRFPSLTFSI